MTGKATRSELLDCIEDLLDQACGSGVGEIDHAFMSSYEDACGLLVAERPDKWEPTHHGIRPIR